MKSKSTSLALLVAVVLLAGCASELGVRSSSKEEWLKISLATPLTGSPMSYKVKNYLVEQALLNEYGQHPDRVIKELNERYKTTKDYRVALALMELCYAQAAKRTGIAALSYYLSSALYASQMLYEGKGSSVLTKYSPLFLYVCSSYNNSTAETIRILQDEKLSLSSPHDIPIVQGVLRLEPAVSHLPYELNHFKKFLLCTDYMPYGFLTSSRIFGMGVPLIAIPDVKKTFEPIPGTTRLFQILDNPYPATGLLRMKPPNDGGYTARLDFLDPYKQDSCEIGGEKVPLEIDMTTPLAYMLKNGAAYDGFQALANPKYMHVPEGLFLLRPYDKDKIPLVIVHGLMSYPRTWSQMVNTLMNDKTIRSKYQIWLFAYPTGFPVLYSAYKLRDALLQAQKVFDPEKTNKAFNSMVIMGHSMGGLLTRYMVQSSGNELEKMVFKEPIDEMKIPEKDREFLNHVFKFKHLPFVKRVIFLSTPHKGSAMTHWSLMRLAVKFIHLPETFISRLSSFGKERKVRSDIEKLMGKRLDEIHGVDGLDPNNPVQRYMAEQPIAVKFNSIIGDERKAGAVGGTDGIVSYKSAYLNGAESELVVKSGHNTQKQPAAIKEVRRILLKHLRENRL